MTSVHDFASNRTWFTPSVSFRSSLESWKVGSALSTRYPSNSGRPSSMARNRAWAKCWRGPIEGDFEQFFAAGGHKGIDAIDIHHYPRLRAPEFVEELLEGLNKQMERHGGRKPIWLTEYGYYADDEPWAIPMPNSGFNRPLRSESLQAAYAVRWATMCLANGVDKIFYHAGTCDGVNRDSLQGIFYEYAGQPHKIYAAQAVMSHLLTPTGKFVKRLKLGEGVKGYLFRDGEQIREA